MTERKIENFEMDQGVHWSAGTDTVPGTVTRVSPSGKSVYVREDRAKLLNGVESGESDALNFQPGGFVGHTSGTQRHEFAPGDGPEIRFSLRADGRFQMSGASSRGSMRSWGVLTAGRARHYDYNF